VLLFSLERGVLLVSVHSAEAGPFKGALDIVTRYFDEESLAPKTRIALEELLPA
jgi:hypothetical protein